MPTSERLAGVGTGVGQGGGGPRDRGGAESQKHRPKKAKDFI